jgi:mRNA interferase RelE/StbE
MVNQRFEIKFHPAAFKEYEKIDNSVVELVDNALSELEVRADEVGKPLRNQQNTKLAGCKEIKLRDAGIRIIFRITSEKVDILQIVYILTIEKRSDDFVFKLAHSRFKLLKATPNILEHLKRQIGWERKKGDK